MSDGEASLEALISALFGAFNRNDVKSFAAAFAEDAEFTNVFGKFVKGRKAVEEFHAPLFSEPRLPGVPSFVNSELRIVDSQNRFLRPDVATIDIKWQQTGAIAPSGQPWGTRTGLMSLVVTREREIWAIAVMHNMDLPEVML